MLVPKSTQNFPVSYQDLICVPLFRIFAFVPVTYLFKYRYLDDDGAICFYIFYIPTFILFISVILAVYSINIVLPYILIACEPGVLGAPALPGGAAGQVDGRQVEPVTGSQ